MMLTPCAMPYGESDTDRYRNKDEDVSFSN